MNPTPAPRSRGAPHWPQPPRPAAGTPNVLVIRFDDVGCSNFRRCGWAIRTPFIDTLANRGLRYSGLHTRAICSTGKRGSQLG